MKNSNFALLCCFLASMVTFSISAQEKDKSSKQNTSQTDFSDRQAIIETIENFYIGDHTGSVRHKKNRPNLCFSNQNVFLTKT